MRGWKGKIDLEATIAEIAGILETYQVARVVGDRYSSSFVKEAFRRHGISYCEPVAFRDPGAVTKQKETYVDKSRAYVEVLPLFIQGRIRILDHPDLVRELAALERRNSSSGKPKVDHPPGGSDDFANALALAAREVSDVARRPRPAISWMDRFGRVQTIEL